MKISLTEQDIYKINRKLSDIRTKLQLLESEFTYIPLGTYSKVLNNIVRYTALTTELRNMVSSCMTELDRHIPSKHLFSNPNPENHE